MYMIFQRRQKALLWSMLLKNIYKQKREQTTKSWLAGKGLTLKEPMRSLELKESGPNIYDNSLTVAYVVKGR